MTSPFGSIFDDLSDKKSKQEMQTRILKLEDRCRVLEGNIHSHKEALKKLNDLMKECIKRIEKIQK